MCLMWSASEILRVRETQERELATLPMNVYWEVMQWLPQLIIKYKWYVILRHVFLFPGGSSEGTCASGFGVCCICKLFSYLSRSAKLDSLPIPLVTYGCGIRTSENISYFLQSSDQSELTSPCSYTLCKCVPDICRIRLDFIVSLLLIYQCSSAWNTFAFFTDFWHSWTILLCSRWGIRDPSSR